MSPTLRIRRRRPAGGGDAPTGPALCRAPYASLHLDQHGDARPCCQSDLILGNVGHQTVTEIWEGDEARRLRAAIDEGDLSVGCDFCAWSVRTGDHRQSYARNFDALPLPGADGRPTQFELALSNACNLQCTMCNGDFSSAIRTHREGRPALPAVYRTDFFAELDSFLPAVTKVNLLGGEPFLSGEALRVLEQLGRLGSDAEITVTTNGTVWSDRVERLMAPLNIGFVVSIDGATRETYEAIRVGADWDRLQVNLDRIAAITRAKGTSLTFAHCLMVENWREFPDLLAWGAELGVPVYVNTVMSPRESSLYHLPASRLQEVIRGLEANRSEVVGLGEAWSTTWDITLARLHDAADNPRLDLDAAIAEMARPRVILDIDLNGIVVGVDAPPGDIGALGLSLQVGSLCRSPSDVLTGGEDATVAVEVVDDITNRLRIDVPAGPNLVGLSQIVHADRGPVGTRVVLAPAAGVAS